MKTDLEDTNFSPPATSKRTDDHTLTDFSRRRHEAAALIPSGPPRGQWVFKLVTAELRGHNVPADEAVKQGVEAVRETDPDFEPRYDPQLLEQ
jgi:hypothetical protein